VLNQDTNDYGVLGGTRLDTSQGSLNKTGNDLDVALEGSGYLEVQTASGVQYTRGGTLQVSSKGQLVTSAGDPVLGDNGPITIAGQPVTISSNGTITAKGAVSGRLKVVEFDASAQVESAGGGYYKITGATATAANGTEVRQGMLEGSNVNPVNSMMELISAQRELESMRRALSLFHSDMDKTAVQDLPHVSS
jgi:flagellar basal-body rod protein FlgF